jgi:hypothetical protein
VREIKFRAWDNVANEMLHCGENVDVLFMLGSAGIECTDIRNVSPDGHDVYKEHLKYMQNTGLIDIQGKPIFEKDVIQDDEGFRWNVFYKHGAFYAECTGLMAKQLLSSVNLFGKVIGNIYENPELLKGGETPCK